MDRASKALFEKENKDLAPIFTPMGTYILVIGKTISNKVKELWIIPMEIHMKALGCQVRKMGKESTAMQMAPFSKVTFSTEEKKVLELWPFLMELE